MRQIAYITSFGATVWVAVLILPLIAAFWWILEHATKPFRKPKPPAEPYVPSPEVVQLWRAIAAEEAAKVEAARKRSD